MHNVDVRAPERNPLRAQLVDDPQLDAVELVIRENILTLADTLISRVGRARTKRLLCQMVSVL